MIQLNIYQLMALRSAINQGWPADLLEQLLGRCGCSSEDWYKMVDAGLVAANKEGRLWPTTEGLKEYKIQSAGRWF